MSGVALTNLLDPNMNLRGTIPLSATISGAEYGLPLEVMVPDAIAELEGMTAKIKQGGFTVEEFLRQHNAWNAPEWSLGSNGKLENWFVGTILGETRRHILLTLDLAEWLKQQDESTLRRIAVLAFNSWVHLDHTRPIRDAEAEAFGDEKEWFLMNKGILRQSEKEFLAIAGLSPNERPERKYMGFGFAEMKT